MKKFIFLVLSSLVAQSAAHAACTVQEMQKNEPTVVYATTNALPADLGFGSADFYVIDAKGNKTKARSENSFLYEFVSQRVGVGIVISSPGNDGPVNHLTLGARRTQAGGSTFSGIYKGIAIQGSCEAGS